MSDETTMWELDVLTLLKQTETWKALTAETAPKVIGPDRAETLHTLNVLSSFEESVSYIRPDYIEQVDILGTQARYVDNTATETNYLQLSKSGLRAAWCTMCSQEWYREVEAQLAIEEEEDRRLRGPRVEPGFWSRYQEFWGDA